MNAVLDMESVVIEGMEAQYAPDDYNALAMVQPDEQAVMAVESPDVITGALLMAGVAGGALGGYFGRGWRERRRAVQEERAVAKAGANEVIGRTFAQETGGLVITQGDIAYADIQAGESSNVVVGGRIKSGAVNVKYNANVTAGSFSRNVKLVGDTNGYIDGPIS